MEKIEYIVTEFHAPEAKCRGTLAETMIDLRFNRGAAAKRGIFVIVSLLCSLCCHAQVYSVSTYSGGTSYRELCSIDVPFPPYHCKVKERRRYENADGLVIIDVGRERERGGIPCRYLDVECGSESFTVWLDRESPKRARELAAESAERDRRLKALLDSGYFQVKKFVLTSRTTSASDQEVLFRLEQREKFHDPGGMRATGPEPNVIRITASTNDLVIWDRIIKEFDKPGTK